MKRKILSFLLALIMILTLLPVQVFAVDTDTVTANPFQDVKQGDWYYDMVQYVRVNGFFEGTATTTFSPDETLTRGMFVTVLGRIVTVDTTQYQGPSAFSDVSETDYFAPYVAWADKHGITFGTGDGKFSPHDPINREQMAAFFVRYFEAFGVEYETGDNVTTTPADIDSVSSYAQDAVLKLWRQGLLIGDGVNYNPNSSATRAEAATICYRVDRVVETWYKEPGVASERVKIDPATGKPYEEQKGKPAWPDYDYDDFGGSYSVSFYDGTRLIETFNVKKGEPLRKVPSVVKSSKAGAILEGYYTNPGCTIPFYAENPVTSNMRVYAKYESMDSNELLTIDSFALMDQTPDVSFRFKPLDGIDGDAASAVTLAVKDGSDPVQIAVKPNGDGTYTVYAPAGFNAGCSYELTLAEGWTFLPSGSGAVQNDSIRTAAFSIYMEEVENLRMNAGIKYIQDDDSIDYQVNGETLEVLANDTNLSGGGSFEYGNADGLGLSEDDILCIYVGQKPDTEGRSATDPAVYVKVSGVSGNTVSFKPLDEGDQARLYEIPDNFPIWVDNLPAGKDGTVNIDQLDINLYTQMVGKDKGTLENARAALGVGDFVSLYDTTNGIRSAKDVYFGLVTHVDEDGTIYFEECTAEDIRHSVDLYKHMDLTGEDLITDEEKAQIEQTIQSQVERSGFGEEAAYMMLAMASHTDGFKNTAGLQNVLIQDEDGNVLSSDSIRYLAARNVGTKFQLGDKVTLKVELITSGSQLHYRNEGVQLAIGVEAEFEVDTADDGKVHINLSATFVQEVAFHPTVKGQLVYKEILFIPVPTGVQVTANIDVKSFTAMSIRAEIFTEGPEDKSIWQKFKDFAKDPSALGDIPGLPDEIKNGIKTVGDALKEIDELKDELKKAIDDLPGYENYISDIWEQVEAVTNGKVNRQEWEEIGEQLEKTDITAELMNMINLTSETGLSTEYIENLSALMDRYSEMLEKETDWVQLVDQEMFNPSSPQYLGIMIGIQGKFVVRADLNLAIGSNLQYEVGKRYSFWFRVGLFKPTSGSSSMDLLDESFAFQFYVMGKIGLKAGVRLKLYVALGSVDAISAGITTELGPYLKLWGFFIYDYSKLRRANTPSWSTREQMAGALYLEFGLYLMVGVEAKALFLDYDKNFVDKEYPLLDAGDRRYYYDTAYKPVDETDEIVIYNDGSAALQPGCVVSMVLPEYAQALRYLDLPTGAQGTGAPNANNYYVKVSNPNFRADVVDGKLVVSVISIPRNVRLMKCDLTLTYKHGKLAFSTVDMSTTVHLVWTSLTAEEYQKFYTASVVIPDGSGGTETIWTQRVRKGEPFDLPTGDEIRSLLSWNDAKYIAGAGYGDQQTEGLTIMQDQQYIYDLAYQRYTLTVEGVEGGGSQTFTAIYGEPLDFSSLQSTGANGPSRYTRFVGLVMEWNHQNLDLSQPVSGSLAEALRAGATATAQYVDDSVTATFTFTGLDHEDISVTLRRGGEPDTSAVLAAALEKDMVIMGFYPAVGPMEGSMIYDVVCGAPLGDAVDITFDANGGSEVEVESRKSGSVLASLADTERYGYIFGGWFIDDGTFQNQVNVNTIVTGPMTLYAKWTPVEVTVTFNVSGGSSLAQRTKAVFYEQLYGELPKPTKIGYRFLGWWTKPDGNGELVTEKTPVSTLETHTLYAYWKPMIDLRPSGGGSLFEVRTRTETYNRNRTYTINDLTSYYNQIPGLVDEEGNPIPTDGFIFTLKPTDLGAQSTGKARDAGVYILQISREADDWYNAYEETHNILVINKADWKTAIWDTRTFTALIYGRDHTLTNTVTVLPPTGDADLPEWIINGMYWRIWRQKKGAFSEKKETHSFGDNFEDNGSGAHVEIWLVFPSGAVSNNYNLPSEILMYSGGIRDLYDKTTNPIISGLPEAGTPAIPLPENMAEPESTPDMTPEPTLEPGSEPEPALEPAPEHGAGPESAPESGTDDGGGGEPFGEEM